MYSKLEIWKYFPINVSNAIEDHYENGKYIFSFKTANNNSYKLNLSKMQMIHSLRKDTIIRLKRTGNQQMHQYVNIAVKYRIIHILL